MESIEDSAKGPEFEAVWNKLIRLSVINDEVAREKAVYSILNAIKEAQIRSPLSFNQRVVMCVNGNCKHHQVIKIISWPHIGGGLYMPGIVMCECGTAPRFMGD